MSRFEEVVNEAIGEVVLGEATFRAETLAQRIAELVRERQGRAARRGHVAARYPEHKPAPVSGIDDAGDLHAATASPSPSARGTRRLVGVAAQGMTACPCAQELVAAARASGSPTRTSATSEIERILDAVPVATHNQRGLGTLHIGAAPSRSRGDRRGAAAGDRRGLDVIGDLRADEARRRGRRSSRRPTAARASSRTACAR